MKFLGYERPDGSVGIRNHVLVIAPTDCTIEPARKMADQVKWAVAVTQPFGCDKLGNEQVINTLVGIGKNPNVAAILLVGLGCETLTVDTLAKGIVESGKPVESVVIQEAGGTVKTVKKGIRLLQAMARDVNNLERKSFDASNLTIAIECGGSDTTSGITANPATGIAADMLIKAGGTVIFSEPGEMVGAEHILAKRAVDEKVRKQIYDMVGNVKKRWMAMGLADSRFITRGNIEGGLTTIEEKSLGAILKGGTGPIQGVLENSRRVLERPTKKGLYLQDGTQHDIPSITHMIAAGAQIVIFTTGRGAILGHAIVPVIKVTGNPKTYEKMKDNMDINAGTIIEGKESVNSVGEQIFHEILKVASGKSTKAEALGYRDFSVYRSDPGFDKLLGIC